MCYLLICTQVRYGIGFEPTTTIYSDSSFFVTISIIHIINLAKVMNKEIWYLKMIVIAFAKANNRKL